MNVPPLTETNLPKVIQAIADLAKGGSNAVRPVAIALSSGQTETVIEDRLCSDRSLPVVVPMNAAAAGSSWYVKSVELGRFVIGHAAAPEGALVRYELRRN